MFLISPGSLMKGNLVSSMGATGGSFLVLRFLTVFAGVFDRLSVIWTVSLGFISVGLEHLPSCAS